jgi:hypothetical protein
MDPQLDDVQPLGAFFHINTGVLSGLSDHSGPDLQFDS